MRYDIVTCNWVDTRWQ